MLPMTANVLQHIRKAKTPLTKAELARRIGVSLSGVSDHVERLSAEGLIMAARLGASSGGRKPKQYTVNPEYGRLLSIEIGLESSKVALTDLTSRIIAEDSIFAPIGEGPQIVLGKVGSLCRQLLQEQDTTTEQIKGIGIGVPGPVEFSSGRPISPSLMPGWDGYPIKAYWAEQMACPCYIDNDVNVMALGEYAEGLELSVPNFIFIKADTGIGSGVIYEGRLYRGATGSAGDIGHFDLGGDVLCWCGNRGCLEATAGGKALVARAAEAALMGNSAPLLQEAAADGSLRLEHVQAGLLALDPLCMALVRESGQAIGRVAAMVVNFSNPSRIAIGGRMAAFGDAFLASIRHSIYQRSLPLATRSLTIAPSVLGERAGLVGGAYMALDELITQATDDQTDRFF